jgi:GNAT superfamily N-acetyltransferase
MAKRPTFHAAIAFVGGKPAGLINCIEGFSTFACKPLLNIHDVVVLAEFRGKGISSQLLKKAEEIANSLGCCKLTLEVLEGNKLAQAAYIANGFAGYQLDPEMGRAMFWQKKL